MLKKTGSILVLVGMVSIIALGCFQASWVVGEEDQQSSGFEIILYFVNSDATGLVAEERLIKTKAEDQLPQIIVEELLRGPKTPELSPTMPEGTALLGVEVEKGKASVNLSKEVQENFNVGAMGEGYIIYSLVNSLTELPDIETVQILVEGRTVESIGGHFLTEEPFHRDEGLITEN